MTDFRALPEDHVLKPLEIRMLEMVADMGLCKVAGGNCVAALRVFADKHPGLVDETAHCDFCEAALESPDLLRRRYDEYVHIDYRGFEMWYRKDSGWACPDCMKRAVRRPACAKEETRENIESPGHDGVAGTVAT